MRQDPLDFWMPFFAHHEHMIAFGSKFRCRALCAHHVRTGSIDDLVSAGSKRVEHFGNDPMRTDDHRLLRAVFDRISHANATRCKIAHYLRIMDERTERADRLVRIRRLESQVKSALNAIASACIFGARNLEPTHQFSWGFGS